MPSRRVLTPQGRPHALSAANHVVVWYSKLDHWLKAGHKHGLAWKIHNSAAAHLAGGVNIKLVGFDEEAYAAWSKRQPKASPKETMERHQQWAVSTLAAEGGAN